MSTLVKLSELGARWAYAIVVAIVLNGALFFAASYLSRDRVIVQDMSAPVAVRLVSLKPPAPPPEEKPREEPKPEPKPQLDFMPELMQPSISALSPMDVQIVLDPSLFSSDMQRGDFVYDIGDLDQPPRAIQSVKPQYTQRLSRRGIEGRVSARIMVLASGAIGKIEIVESEPPGVFDALVLDALSKWKYRPGTINGQAVASRVLVPFVFNLED